MPIAKAVTWLITENPCTWAVVKTPEDVYLITLTNGNKKADMFYNESKRGATGMYVNDKSIGGSVYQPEEFDGVFQSTVAWLKQQSMAERARKFGKRMK